ncbi:LOW QUALITY PROTEIN: olfactory receptor 4C16 [Dasypus novemcinctus]|uniref:LOW QUALITY PROTEIN: olfactory receptor 4C16 n=1 Tax=Dasypus novemcinctus TaxID=9361 RepID=UPI0039C8F4E8
MSFHKNHHIIIPLFLHINNFSHLLLIHEIIHLHNNGTEFVLVGLTQDSFGKKIRFIIFLFFYLRSFLGNLLIIVTIKNSQVLRSPMYFFPFYSSLSDTCFSTSIAPRMIVHVLSKTTISFTECIIQFFSLNFFGCLEIFILILMAIDCFIAIGKPLHYETIRSWWVYSVFVAVAWVGSCVHFLVQIFLALSLLFCGPNVIDQYFLNLQPLLKLTCCNCYVINLLLVSNSGAISIVSFIMLMFSYAIILHYSAEGRNKTLSISNCYSLSASISHIIIVILFFLPCIFTYTHLANIYAMGKMIIIFCTTGTLLLNPLIYTLRNAEVKIARRKL